MLIPFSTSQYGKVQILTIYKYEFTEKYLADVEKKKGFINYIIKNQDIDVFEINDTYFTLFRPLKNMFGPQYKETRKVTIEAPFPNTSKISSYIGSLVRTEFCKSYKKYLNQNVFGVHFFNFNLLRLIKGFEFNIEMFDNGEFYIHFLPTSKIVSNGFIDCQYIINLINSSKNGVFENFKISVINSTNFRTKRFDLSDKESINKLREMLSTNQKYVATFDYHFLANYSPEIFTQIDKLSEKELITSIDFLSDIVNKLNFPDWILTSEKKFIRFASNSIGDEKNLLVGGNAIVKDQKAAFYNGVYMPVSDKIIVPLLNDKFGDISLFFELFSSFNKNGENIEILEPLEIDFDNDTFIKTLLSIKNKNRLREKTNKKILLVIFTKFMMVKEDLNKFKDLGFRFQLYLGYIDKYQLSNFTVKCIEKLGGILNVIKNTEEPRSTYFIGIDLGHSTNQLDKKFTNLGMVLFNNQGIFLKKAVNKGIVRNEALTEDSIEKPLKELMLHIKNSGFESPKKIIIHRDGKLHKSDTDNLLHKLSELFDIIEFDIVEIIKSGYPVLAQYDTEKKTYFNLESGNCWVNYEKKYAVMVTNIQADIKKSVLNPIIIKHKYGQTDFMIILYQVYWFTKIYTNNLYNSTRLPATTLKANNIVNTSDKIHVSSNLG